MNTVDSMQVKSLYRYNYVNSSKEFFYYLKKPRVILDFNSDN